MGKRSRSKSPPRPKIQKSRTTDTIIPETSPTVYNRWPSAQRQREGEGESDSEEKSGSEMIRRDVFTSKDKVNYLTFLKAQLMQEYGILPHSRTYYCLLFSLYHMFIVFVISY